METSVEETLKGFIKTWIRFARMYDRRKGENRLNQEEKIKDDQNR